MPSQDLIMAEYKLSASLAGHEDDVSRGYHPDLKLLFSAYNLTYCLGTSSMLSFGNRRDLSFKRWYGSTLETTLPKPSYLR